MNEGETSATPIVVQAQPTETDYREALAAHAKWPRVLMKARKPARRVVPLLIGGVIAALLIAPEFEKFSLRAWSMDPLSLLAALLGFPVTVFATNFAATLSNRTAALRPNGLVVWPGTDGGKASARKWRGLAGWVVFMAITTVFFVLNKRPQPPSSVLPASPSDVPLPALPVSGSLLFFGSVMATVLPLLLLVKLQSRRAAAKLVSGMPALLLSRTWEFSESGLSERGELLQSFMKWEYLQKFMEAPDHILLYPSDQTFFLVPKRAFADELQLSVFLGLLSRKVPNGVMQKRWGAFPVLAPVPALSPPAAMR